MALSAFLLSARARARMAACRARTARACFQMGNLDHLAVQPERARAGHGIEGRDDPAGRAAATRRDRCSPASSRMSAYRVSIAATPAALAASRTLAPRDAVNRRPLAIRPQIGAGAKRGREILDPPGHRGRARQREIGKPCQGWGRAWGLGRDRNDAGVPRRQAMRGLESIEIQRQPRRAACPSVLASIIPSGAPGMMAARSASALSSSGLMRREGRLARACRAGQMSTQYLARNGLAVGGDRIFQIEDQRIGAGVVGLAQRPVAVGGNEQP